VSLEAGTILRGDNAEYKITNPIGEGAHGQAFLALVLNLLPGCHPRIQRVLSPGDPVIVKVPPALADTYSLDERRTFLRRLQDEFSKEYRTFDQLADAKSAAHVYDIGVVKVPIGEFREPSLFVVYEHIKGERLDTYVDRMATTHGRRGVQSVALFFDLARKLTEALAEIHQAGVVHGDIWPKNIMLRKTIILRENGDPMSGGSICGDPIYIDFGQAVVRREIARAERVDRSHPYLTPEREASVQADVYALCGTLFFLATGHAPPRERL